MKTLTCDVCGGNLIMNAGGQTATCQFCGMMHSIERMREKVQKIRGTVSIEGQVSVEGISTVASLLERAREFEETNEWETAISYYNRALDIEPSNGEARDGLTRVKKQYEPVVGETYDGIVIEIMRFGCFVELKPSKRKGMIHIFKFSRDIQAKTEDFVSVGDRLRVKVIEIDHAGRIALDIER